MQRRAFLTLAAASIASGAAAAGIRRITLAPIECRFHKFVAMNSYDRAPKGHTYSNILVRIQTNEGVEGVGVMGYTAPDAQFHHALKTLIGADPLSLYEMKDGRITGRAAAFSGVLGLYRHLDGPLFDLIGKLTAKPAWQLIGSPVRDRVEVYDGTLYFSDVLFSDRGTRAVVEEVEEAQKKGYNGVKLKMGRGWKWMDREAGLLRDVEVTHAVRKAAGPQMKVLVDGNNGYQNDMDRLWRYISGTAADNLFWLEEMIPEDVATYTALRQRMQKAGIKGAIAEGESVRGVAEFEPYLKPNRLFDVLQMDIRTGGFIDNMAVARMAAEVGATSVPHNWGSQIGGYMGLHLSKAIAAVPAAEDDRSTCDVIIAEGYNFRGGSYSVPNSPGLSLRVDEKVYQLKCKPAETAIE
jgi:D-galactarolactone cycloisomerase